MNGRVRFFVFFPFLAFVMKVVGEFVHEVMGHGFFVLLFGGKITRIHISLLWPYRLSGYGYDPPIGGFEAWQLPFIHGGGILVCLVVSFAVQALLILRGGRNWRISMPLFWGSFWTFLNPSGYLILGGIKPFGDVWHLINDGVLTQGVSLMLGFIIFIIAFYSHTKILKKLLITSTLIKNNVQLRVSLSLFWLIIPLTTLLALSGLTFLPFDVLFFLVSLMPSVLILILYR